MSEWSPQPPKTRSDNEVINLDERRRQRLNQENLAREAFEFSEALLQDANREIIERVQRGEELTPELVLGMLATSTSAWRKRHMQVLGVPQPIVDDVFKTLFGNTPPKTR